MAMTSVHSPPALDDPSALCQPSEPGFQPQSPTQHTGARERAGNLNLRKLQSARPALSTCVYRMPRWETASRATLYL